MNQQHHQQGQGHSHGQPPKWGLHKDWRTWVAVGLMLLAMVIYVMSLDESVRPAEDGAGPVVPAAP